MSDKSILEVRNLNEIRRYEKCGIYEQCLLQTEQNYSQLCDYMQKINYCIQDLNEELSEVSNLSRKTVVYIISLTDWIKDAVKRVREMYCKDIIDGFNFAKEGELEKCANYLSALRAFVVAHPLNTSRHTAYGMDGSLICVDIRTSLSGAEFLKNEYFARLDFDGYHKGEKCKSDFYLYGYSKEINDMKYAIYIGCSLYDIYHTARLYIEKLYALDKYLYGQNCKIST